MLNRYINFHPDNKTLLPSELSGAGRFVLSRQDFTPGYGRTFEGGILPGGAGKGVGSLGSVRVCPRECAVGRFNNKVGGCKRGRLARGGSAFPHFGEEDCLRGWTGSG